MRYILTIGLLFLCGLPPAVAQEPAQEQNFDPYHAEKSIEIGLYYMKKGNYDAAIDRFQDAARYRANFARPYLLMGQAYEKKGDKVSAIAAYKKYLEILPNAPDAEKIQKRIGKLTRDVERAARRKSG